MSFISNKASGLSGALVTGAAVFSIQPTPSTPVKGAFNDSSAVQKAKAVALAEAKAIPALGTFNENSILERIRSGGFKHIWSEFRAI